MKVQPYIEYTYDRVRQACGHILKSTGNNRMRVTDDSGHLTTPYFEEVFACPCGEFTIREAGTIDFSPRPATAQEITTRIEEHERVIARLRQALADMGTSR